MDLIQNFFQYKTKIWTKWYKYVVKRTHRSITIGARVVTSSVYLYNICTQESFPEHFLNQNYVGLLTHAKWKCYTTKIKCCKFSGVKLLVNRSRYILYGFINLSALNYSRGKIVPIIFYGEFQFPLSQTQNFLLNQAQNTPQNTSESLPNH